MFKELSTEESRIFRERFFKMVLNALIGYMLVEGFALTARAMGLISTSYSNILILSGVVNCAMILFLLILYFKKSYTHYSESIYFTVNLFFFIGAFSWAVYLANEVRIVALVCALIAVTIELPFTSPFQSLLISISAIITYNATSYFAVTFGGQDGAYIKEFYYSLIFIPPMILISVVARQIRNQKEKIEADKDILEKMNEGLNDLNIELQTAHERSMAEMQLAGFVQSHIFPETPPESVGWDIALSFKPASSVSGDFYDFYYTDNELKGISLFDVSGHGVAAGLITMIAKPIVRRMFQSQENIGLNRLMKQASEVFFREIKRIDSFVTGIVIRFNGTSAEYVNIGHHDILLKKIKNKAVKPVALKNQDYRSGPIGKNFGKPEFKTIKFPIEKGDILCLMTDGILEGRSSSKERFGKNRLMESLKNAPQGSAKEIIEFIMDTFNTFMDGSEPADDYALIRAS